MGAAGVTNGDVVERHPALVAAGFYLALVAVLLATSLAKTGGTFVYAQDDPYIHLSMARTLADFGVWGIRPDAFASASSSPLWTLLLAGVAVAGMGAVWWPFVLNVLAGLGVIWICDRVVRTALPPRPRLAALVAVIVIAPLPTLAFVGMEHSLQLAITVAFVWSVMRLMAADGARHLGAAAGLAALLVATRYEGLFVVVAAFAVLVWKGRWKAGALVLVAASVPVAAFALFSMAHGGGVLPNSVLMKSNPARFATLGSTVASMVADVAAVVTLYRRPAELVLALAVGLALIARRGQATTGGRRAAAWAAVFVGAELMHSAFVKLEFFYRYEAYLMVLGVLSLALLWSSDEGVREGARSLKAHAGGRFVLALLALPLAVRAMSAFGDTPIATKNVFEQQYQMGLFFRDAYQETPVALNDIGAVSWLSTAQIVDIYGLATQEVADLKRHGRWNADALDALAARRNVRAIAMYERVLATLIPRDWILVGEWRISGNVAVSEDTVGFYAPTPDDATRLGRALETYAGRLPAAVTYVPGPPRD
jgi:hypothetical protein